MTYAPDTRDFPGTSAVPGGAAAARLRSASETGEFGLLTFNLGLLAAAIPGAGAVSLSDHVQPRLRAAPGEIAALGADVVALQEVFDPLHQSFLAGALRGIYPHAVAAPGRRTLFGSGLMLLSRHRLEHVAFTRSSGSVIAQTGFLSAELCVPAFGRLRVVNVHLKADIPLARTESPGGMTRRQRELRALLATIRNSMNPTILLGDFNTSPEIVPSLYRGIVEAGFADCFAASATTAAQRGAVTWDAANPLNLRGLWRSSPSQRIDHVFVSKSCHAPRPAAAEIVLCDACVGIPGGGNVPLSDHYGLLVSLAPAGANDAR